MQCTGDVAHQHVLSVRDGVNVRAHIVQQAWRTVR